MKRTSFLVSSVMAALAFVCTLNAPGVASAQDKLLITQVYGGGGSSSTSASYKTDFVEIFNAGTTPVDLSAYSVQYGPATGTNATFFTGITQLNSGALSGGTLAPGQYFLIQEGSAGTGGATLTGADQTGTVNLAQSAGKVALVKGSTLLGTTTGGCSDSSIVSLVGYGTIDSSCAAGAASVPALAVNTAAIRKQSCTDSNNNANDFNVATPSPRNSSTALAACNAQGSEYATIANAVANPASVTAGNPTTLTVVVTPNMSTGISVYVDLTAIGGAQNQQLALSGDNTYTFQTIIAGATPAGDYSLPVLVTDNASHTATGSIALSVALPITVTPIATLQGNRSTYVGQTIATTGVVTGIGPAGFFLQTASTTPGASGVSDGVYAYAGTGKVPAIAVGDSIKVTGTLALYPSAAQSHTPALEINNPAVVVLSSGNPLPAAVPLSASNLSPNGGLSQLTRYESMRVSMGSLTAISGTDGSLNEATETVTSNGQFYAEFTGTPRPFREPGVDIRDFPSSTDLSNGPYTTTGGVTYASKPALFDDNPERILVDSHFFGGAPIDLSTGAIVTGAVGILDFTYSSDSYYDPARFLIASGNTPTITAGMTVQPVPLSTSGQFTVAAFNVERFFNPNAADDIYYNAGTGKTGKSLAVDITPEAYARRLKKVSLAIRNVLNTPDIVSVEEIENQSVAQDIANEINNDAVAAGQPNPNYVGYGIDASTGTYTDDVGGISVGFLVKSNTVDALSVQQYGNTDVMPNGGSTLNDRPPFVLHAGVKRAGGTDYPVTVISNHLRSLSGISTSASTRLKKELQAEYLANMIQSFQTNGEHVVALGDMNAFEFSDAYTDTMATITNRNVLSPDVMAQPGGAGLVDPPATDLVTLMPAEERWSYIESGNAQVLDHVVVTQDLVDAGASLVYAHLNAGFPLVSYNDPNVPDRTSDHDAAVTYLTLPAVRFTGSLAGNGSFGVIAVGDSSGVSSFTLTNTGEGALNIAGITATGDYAESDNCGSSLAIGYTCTINVVFTPTATGTRTGTLTVNSNATNLAPVALTGTGAVPSVPTLTRGPVHFGKVTVGSSSAPQSFTLANPGAAPVHIGTIAVSNEYSETSDCGATLAGNSSCTITVVFSPTWNGSGVGDLVVTTTGAGATTLDSRLIGVAQK